MRCRPYTRAGQALALGYARGELDRPGVRVEVLEVRGVPCLYAEAGPTRGPIPLLMIGHLDVLPGDCTPRLLDGWLHGRGAGDMLSGDSVGIEVLRECAGGPDRVGMLLATDEEQTTAAHAIGALARRFGPDVRAAIAFEASDLAIGAQSKGALRLAFEVIGESAHSAYLERGRDAFEHLVDVVRPALGACELLRVPSELFPEGSTARITRVTAGESDTSTPGRASGLIDVRYVPTLDRATVLRELRAAIPTVHGYRVRLNPRPGWMPAMATPPDHPVITTVAGVVSRHTGRPTRVEGRRGSSDAVFFEPAMELGPIAEGVHATGERVNLASVATLYRAARELPAALRQHR